MFNNPSLNASANQLLVPQGLRAARIIRVSTAEQAEEGRSGLERQRIETDRIISSKGYRQVMSIELVDVSGTASFLSPEIIELVRRVESREIDVIVVAEMSRLIRPDDLSSFAFLDVFKRHGVSIDCGGSNHDLTSPEGYLSGGIQALLGGHERMQMLRKMMQSKEARRAAGGCPGSEITLPLGLCYDRTANRYHYGPEVWKVVEAFRLIDEEGIRNLSEIGRRVSIHHRTLKGLLGNKSYIGIREYVQMRDQSQKRTKAGGRQGDRPKIKRPPDKIISVRIIPPEEQAVTNERFARVQIMLREMADRHARYIAPNKGSNLLAGIGHCGYCGQILYTANKSGAAGGGWYICKSHHYKFRKVLSPCAQGWMPKSNMDELISTFTLKLLDDPSFVAALLTHGRQKQENIVQLDALPSAIRKQLADIDQRDRRLLDAIEAGVMSLQEAKQRRLRLEEEKRGLLASLESAEERLVETDMPPGLIGRIGALGPEAWTSLETPQQRKVMLSTLFSEVYVQGESITAFRFAPSLVGRDSEKWGWVADVPVVLPLEFRLKPLPETVELPPEHRRCSRCGNVLPESEFWGARAACKNCCKADNRERYRRKVGANAGDGG